MNYKFKNGMIAEFDDIEETNSEHKMFKVNLPETQENYISGNGEGVWACGNSKTLNAWRKNKNKGIYFAMVLNDSVYYPKLKCGMIIPIEMRGDKRPVALYEELLNNYEIDFENIEMTKKMLMMKMLLDE